MRNELRGYVVQLDLDKHTVRLRDCPSSEGMGALVFEGYAHPLSVRGFAHAMRFEYQLSAEVDEGRLRFLGLRIEPNAP